MLNIKLIKSDSVSIIDPTEEGKDQQETPKEIEIGRASCRERV